MKQPRRVASPRVRPVLRVLSPPLPEEQAFCARLGAVRSSSSEGLARAPGVSSEASLESNEVRLLLLHLPPPFPFLVSGPMLTARVRWANLLTKTVCLRCARLQGPGCPLGASLGGGWHRPRWKPLCGRWGISNLPHPVREWHRVRSWNRGAESSLDAAMSAVSPSVFTYVLSSFIF